MVGQCENVIAGIGIPLWIVVIINKLNQKVLSCRKFQKFD